MMNIHRFFRLIFAFLVFEAFFCLLHGFKRPNVVIILVDDMGFDDVSFRGSDEIITPNIDALGYSGLILNNFYTAAMCTPSRAALLTGKYPIKTGMNHYVITNYQPWGLPLNETTMANIFRKHGYYTSLLGKWHLGMSRKSYTPTLRGFDYHFGYLGAYVDYYNQSLYSPSRPYARGHDFRKNLGVSHDHIGTYMTDLLTDEAVKLIEGHDYSKKSLFMLLSHLAPHTANEDLPLQAPKEEIEKFKYIVSERRRIYAAMLSIVDKGVGQVIDALYKKGVLNDTIVIFLSDNGGPTAGSHATRASNYPLRGQKNSPWEGGVRSSAVLWTSQLLYPGSVLTQRMYIADILPTLASAAGIDFNRQHLNGLDMWGSILSADNKRIFGREIVHNIDKVDRYVSYMLGQYKYINGTTLRGGFDQWLGRRPPKGSNRTDPRAAHYESVIKHTSVWQQLQELNQESTPEFNEPNITNLRLAATIQCPAIPNKRDCQPLTAPCLFDIDADPCEMNNVFEDPSYAPILETILLRIQDHSEKTRLPRNKPDDPLCDPSLYGNEWTWWQDIQDQRNAGTEMSTAVQLDSWLFMFIFLPLVRVVLPWLKLWLKPW